MHAATEAIGLMASLGSFLLWVPQGIRVWRGRRDPAALRGIALSTQVIALAGSVLWVTYAALVGSFWVGAPVVVTGPVAVMTITVLVRGRRSPRLDVEPAAPAAAAPSAEQVALAA